jgi:hypothetical protein
MQAAWLFGALVVPQLLGFGHGARGAQREWEGGWGGALEEEREREALMLKVSGRLELWAWEGVREVDKGLCSQDGVMGSEKDSGIRGT